MGSSFRVWLVSVGVMAACGYAGPSVAQTVSEAGSGAQPSPAVGSDEGAIPAMDLALDAQVAHFQRSPLSVQATAALDRSLALRSPSSKARTPLPLPAKFQPTPLKPAKLQSAKRQAAKPLSTPSTVSTPSTSSAKPVAFDPAMLAQAIAPDAPIVPLSVQDSARVNRAIAAPVAAPDVSISTAAAPTAPATTTAATPTTPAPGPVAPLTTPAPPATPALPPAPGQSKPVGPAKPGAAPEYLYPPANPLYFPTKAPEVKLQGIQPISLKQAIELAERSSGVLQEQRLQLQSSQAALREAKAANFPTLDFQAGVNHSRSSSGQLAEEAQRQNIFRGANQDTASTNLSGNLAVNYDVFTSGQRTAQIKAAERQAKVSELLVESTLEQLRLDVTGDYYAMQSADESVRINEAAVRNAQISLKDAEALERAGLGTRFDVLRSQVQLADAQQQLTSAKSQQRISRRQLAQRISLAPTIDLAAADPVQVAGQWLPSLEDSIVLAFKNRAELQEQLARRESAQQLRKAALAALGPRVGVSARYEFLDSFDDEFGIADGYSLGATIRWSLLDGGAARARADQQEVAAKTAETRFNTVRDRIRFDVEEAYSTLQSTSENITTSTRALEQATEALRLARLRFQAGVGTQTDVINAETDLTRAEGRKVTAILDYNRAMAQMQRAVSNLPPIPSAPSAP
jgi:outer membrane protein TolC